jgi:tRNA threonylcarbamoyladenosine biosynthesis protein TsaE
MKPLSFISGSPEETLQFGRMLGGLARPGDVYLLFGQLGAGKTCLTQGIARGLGSNEYATSPTFVLMREIAGRLNLYHIDFYRLDNLEEIADLGLDDYFYGDGVCVVEWSEKAAGLLPTEHLEIRITYLGETERRFTVTPSGTRYQALVAGLRAERKGKTEV